jgi:hypothetical protein
MSSYRFLGALLKGEIGLEAMSPMSDEILVVCRSEDIPAMLTAIQKRWPDAVREWIIEIPIITVPDKCITIPSRSGGDAHIITHRSGRWTCSCVGYSYRATCWALEEVKANPNLY